MTCKKKTAPLPGDYYHLEFDKWSTVRKRERKELRVLHQLSLSPSYIKVRSKIGWVTTNVDIKVPRDF